MNVGADALVVDDDGRVLLVRRPTIGCGRCRAAGSTPPRRWSRGRCARFSRRPASTSQLFGCFTQRGGRAASIAHTGARSLAASFVTRRSRSTWGSITPTPCAGLARRSPRAGGRSARCPIIASSMSRGVPDRAHRAAGNACAARGRWRRFSGCPSGGAADAGGAPSAASGIEPGRDMGVPSGQCLPAHACAPAVAGRAFAQVMLTRRAGDTADIHGRVTPPAYFHRRNSGPGELTEIRTE
jgi:hypothetical protein